MIQSLSSLVAMPSDDPQKSPAPFSKRFQQVTSTMASYAIGAGKVTFVAAIILGVIFLPTALAASSHCQGDQCRQITPYSPYAARFMNNGMQLVMNGTVACKIEMPLDTEASCAKAATFSYNYAKTNGMLAKHMTPITFREKGFSLTMGSPNHVEQLKSFHVGLNSEKLANYKTALKHIEKTILEKSVPFQESPSEVVSQIKEIHRLISQNLPDEKLFTPGRFRTQWNIIDSTENPDNLSERAAKVLSPEEYQKFELTRALFPVFPTFTREERAIWNKVVYVPPGPEHIERKMTLFATRLKTRIVKEQDTVALASWAHTEIAHISPFPDGNGRLARALMNAIFAYRHEDSVIFDDDERYCKAVDESLRRPEAFTEYLRTHAIPWTQKHKDTLLASEERHSFFSNFMEWISNNSTATS